RAGCGLSGAPAVYGRGRGVCTLHHVTSSRLTRGPTAAARAARTAGGCSGQALRDSHIRWPHAFSGNLIVTPHQPVILRRAEGETGGPSNHRPVWRLLGGPVKPGHDN